MLGLATFALQLLGYLAVLLVVAGVVMWLLRSREGLRGR